MTLQKGGKEYAFGTNGQLYEVNPKRKTCRKVMRSFDDFIDLEIIEEDALPLNMYYKYLYDRFGEFPEKHKKGNVISFRGVDICIDDTLGFYIQSSVTKNILETPFDGFPSPRELGDWLEQRGNWWKNLTAEQKKKASEKGSKRVERTPKDICEKEETNFEVLRVKVLHTIRDMRKNNDSVNPKILSNMIPFRRWRRRVNVMLKELEERKQDFVEFLSVVEKYALEEDFTKVGKEVKKNNFAGTKMPKHSVVGDIIGNKIEVDGKLLDAVPFLVEYLLSVEVKCMPQLMKWANGKITTEDLLDYPLKKDGSVRYEKNIIPNTEENVKVICDLYESANVVCPHELLFTDELKVGDRIRVLEDGKYIRKKVIDTSHGIVLGSDVGLMRTDKWYKE